MAAAAAHVDMFLFDNGLTDEWGGRCDLHACHLDRLSLARSLAQAAPLNVNVNGGPATAATRARRTFEGRSALRTLGSDRSAILFARAPS